MSLAFYLPAATFTEDTPTPAEKPPSRASVVFSMISSTLPASSADKELITVSWFK